MSDQANLTGLIESLTLVRDRVGEISYPTHCEHDVMTLTADPERFSEADREYLSARGFTCYDDGASFQSFHYGSA